jgi:hypothetical protein
MRWIESWTGSHRGQGLSGWIVWTSWTADTSRMAQAGQPHCRPRCRTARRESPSLCPGHLHVSSQAGIHADYQLVCSWTTLLMVPIFLLAPPSPSLRRHQSPYPASVANRLRADPTHDLSDRLRCFNGDEVSPRVILKPRQRRNPSLKRPYWEQSFRLLPVMLWYQCYSRNSNNPVSLDRSRLLRFFSHMPRGTAS